MGARCVVSFRGYEYPSRLIRPLRSLVDRYIVCSKPVKSHIVNVLGIPEAKIAYIYDPVDTDIFSPEVPPADLERLFGVPRGRKVFAIFGRLVPWKGHAVFLKAARLVLEAVPEAHAMIVGDTADGEPAYGDELRELSSRAGDRGPDHLHRISIGHRTVDESVRGPCSCLDRGRTLRDGRSGRYGMRPTLCRHG